MTFCYRRRRIAKVTFSGSDRSETNGPLRCCREPENLWQSSAFAVRRNKCRRSAGISTVNAHRLGALARRRYYEGAAALIIIADNYSTADQALGIRGHMLARSHAAAYQRDS